METTCIVCPIGCKLKIEKINNEVVVSGNLCFRGANYGKTEFTNPTRIVTCSLVGKDIIYFTKTSLPVPKNQIFEIINKIKNLPIKDYKMGDIIEKNILNTGADIIVTGYHDRQQI